METRQGVITRGYRHRQHIIAANVDTVIIVSAFAEPGLKLSLIDRYLVAAEMGGVRPVIAFNKADLVDVSLFQWVLGLYSQLGYETIVTSAADGRGSIACAACCAGGHRRLGAERRRQELAPECHRARVEPQGARGFRLDRRKASTPPRPLS